LGAAKPVIAPSTVETEDLALSYRGCMTDEEIARFVTPERVFSRLDILARPSPVPARPGVYGWWFRQLPPRVVGDGCCRQHGLTLLYAGISPDRPPRNGRPASRQHLRQRITYHYTGNAEGSTLRKTLGCLLADELGLQLRRVGSGKRMTFLGGEQTLNAWMDANAYVSWVIHDSPWQLENNLITMLGLPLNLQGNKHNPFHPVLSEERARSAAQARTLPVLPNPDRRTISSADHPWGR
jgi:hypothetical protein